MEVSIRVLIVLSLLFISAISQAATPPRFQRVIMVVLENTNINQAMKAEPLRSFAQNGIYFSNFKAETHPSQPNYLAMIAGDTFGLNIFNRGDRVVNLPHNHLGDLLEAKGLTWKAYAEDYPGDCFTGPAMGKYVRKHVPFMSFTNVTSNPSRCANIVGTDVLRTDWASNQLPNFSLVVPNLDNDGHDTNVITAAEWVKENIFPMANDPLLMSDTLLILTFDESRSFFNGNKIYTAMYSPNLPEKMTIKDGHNHYSLLKMIETEWDLGSLGRKDSSANSIRELVRP